MELRRPAIGMGVGDVDLLAGLQEGEELRQFVPMHLEPADMTLAVLFIAVDAMQHLRSGQQPPDADPPRPGHLGQGLGKDAGHLPLGQIELIGGFRQGAVGGALPSDQAAAIQQQPRGAIGAQPLANEQGRQSRCEGDDDHRHRQGLVVVVGDKSDEVRLGHRDQDPPVLADLLHRCRRRNVVLAADVDDMTPLAFDAEAVIGGRQHRIPDLVDPGGYRAVLALLQDLAGIGIGDQVAAAVHDQGLAVRADFEGCEEMRQFLQRDVDADDAEVAVGLPKSGGNRDPGLPVGEEDVDAAPEDAIAICRALIPGAGPRVVGILRVLLAADLDAGSIAVGPGDAARAGRVADLLHVGSVRSAAPDHDEIPVGIGDVDVGELRDLLQQADRQVLQDGPALRQRRGRQHVVGQAQGACAGAEEGRDLLANRLVEGGQQIVGEGEDTLAVGFVGIDRDGEDRGDHHGDAEDRHDDPAERATAAAARIKRIVDVVDQSFAGLHAAGLGLREKRGGGSLCDRRRQGNGLGPIGLMPACDSWAKEGTHSTVPTGILCHGRMCLDRQRSAAAGTRRKDDPGTALQLIWSTVPPDLDCRYDQDGAE